MNKSFSFTFNSKTAFKEPFGSWRFNWLDLLNEYALFAGFESKRVRELTNEHAGGDFLL